MVEVFKIVHGVSILNFNESSLTTSLTLCAKISLKNRRLIFDMVEVF